MVPAGEELIAGRYRLQEPIGSGGMGEVWRAFDEELRRVVAVKRAHEDGRGTRREARIGAGFQHPHVISVYDVVAEDDQRWLVMEFLPSVSLAELLTERGRLPVAETARIGAQVADALAAVHARGVVHRDIKPGNILVTEDGLAKLTDFGISRAVWSEVTLTDSGSAGGTPAYFAPEVAEGRDPEPASDVFSLGASLFAAVEGRSPFGEADNPLAVLRRAAACELEPVRRAGALAPVLAALLRREPGERPDAGEARRLLDEIARTGSAKAVPPPGAGRRRARRLVLLAAAATAAVALAVTWTVLPDRPRTISASVAAPQPPPLIGDPRTADPCALLDPAALGRFGETELDIDYGNFTRCDVLVNPDTDREVDVEVEFEAAGAPAPGETAGTLNVAREPEHDGECERTVLPTEQTRVVVTAKLTENGPADLCAMADVATGTVVSVLGRGPIPRRLAPFDAKSLALVDACSLLNPPALEHIPGVDATHPEAGFAGWRCRWHSTTSDLAVILRYDRHQPLTAASGRPTRLGGREAFVQPGDDDSCEVQVVHRPYTDDDGKRAVELVLLTVSGKQPSDRLCGLATELATAAATALPPP
ncbi:protein kinase domain-containing protein [Amycolatopsis anabasis]|uniref:protein kinase domain-containing protein n=1 Tax=Amycolatopsis anabasis TaxID=1840409 RepID=UPI00131D4423|nr:serine/threonine-protein kinase [Amycolatopsis anabasis]